MVGTRVLSPCLESLAGSQRCVRTCPGVVWGAFLRSRDDVKFSPFLRAYSSEFLELGAGVSLRKSIIYVALSHITHFRGELCGCLERCSVRWHGAFQACYADFWVLNISTWSATQFRRTAFRWPGSWLFLQRQAQVPLVTS